MDIAHPRLKELSEATGPREKKASEPSAPKTNAGGGEAVQENTHTHQTFDQTFF